MVKLANEIWRDFNIEAVPTSGAHYPIKPDIREWGTSLETGGSTFAVWPGGTLRTMQQRATDTYCILDAPGSPDPTGVNDSTTALKAMFAEGSASGVRMELTVGDFVTEEPLLMKRTGQILFGHGMGYGVGDVDRTLRFFQPQSRIIASGTMPRRILTRRLARASVADPQDATMSAVVEVHADGAVLRDFAVWLNCDYTNASPTNFGDDVDVGVFVGCRPGVQMEHVGVYGYFRKAGIYFDVTRSNTLPELLDPDGVALPVGASGEVFAGGDGANMLGCFIRGGRIGLAILGAQHATNYYDQILGAAVSDGRGASGFSDFSCINGEIYGGGHHSGRRLANPGVSPLTQGGLDAEPTFSPASLYIDGWAGNSGSTSHGQGAIRGMVFHHCRFATPEIFRVRFGLCDEIYFTGRAWSEAGSTGVTLTDTGGAPVDVHDYVNNTYGHFSGHSTKTGFANLEFATGGVINQTWLDESKFAGRDGQHSRSLAGQYNGDSSALPSFLDAMLDIRDNAASPTEKGGISMRTYRPFIKLIDVSGSAKDWQIRVDGNAAQELFGDNTAGVALGGVAGITSLSTGAKYSGEVTINNDSVVSLTPPQVGGRIVLTHAPDLQATQQQLSGTLLYDTGSGINCRIIEGGTNFAMSATNGSTNLTGTTGTVGNVTLCGQLGVVKIENRTGGSSTWRYTWLS